MHIITLDMFAHACLKKYIYVYGIRAKISPTGTYVFSCPHAFGFKGVSRLRQFLE